MNEDIKDIIDKINTKHLKNLPSAQDKRKPSKIKQRFSNYTNKLRRLIGDYLDNHKKGVVIVVLSGILLLIVASYFGADFVTKRQDYPIRKVLYQCQESTSFAGREGHLSSKYADRSSVSIITQGNTDGTKLGEMLGIFKNEITDETLVYQLEDKSKTRIAYTPKKREIVQAGLRLKGSVNFSEEFAELIDKPGKFITYSFIPERGRKNIEINVLVDEEGRPNFVNELVTYREIPLGSIWGTNFRDKTKLNEFPKTDKNEELFRQLIQLIDDYNNKTLAKIKREKLVKQMLDIEEHLDKIPIFVSYEDGMVDILPQESTTYLFSDPSLIKRIKNLFSKEKDIRIEGGRSIYPKKEDIIELRPLEINNSKGDIIKIRVENIWDLWPGNYWGLNKLSIGRPPNSIKPFAHCNNGGYVIRDSCGDIAKVVIRDFILYYGDDVLYLYYLDKNGDGKIDEERELIGQVLYRTSHDQKSNVEREIDSGDKKKDFTRRVIYSFMAGCDWEKRFEEFYLCNTIESFIVNEVNRGFGKHSKLGWVNNQRSNILLLENRSVQNLARALTPESSLVAKYDIIALFRAAGRSYVEAYILPTDGK
ncbi:MAG: hypothetical protein V1872_09580 [bacterium]